MQAELTPQTSASLDKAMTLLRMLDGAKREEVLQRLPDDQRDQLRKRLEDEGVKDAPSVKRGSNIAEQRQLMRETAMSMHERVMERIAKEKNQQSNEVSLHNPLIQLREVHPAALAKAMQGERAEAWAMVLDHIDDNASTAIMSYLDHDARRAIAIAQDHQRTMPEALRATAERAIQQAIVPRALKEHQMLMIAPARNGAPHFA